MNIVQLTKIKILLFLVILWVIIAFFNVTYNTIKSVSEAKQWMFLTNQQKQTKIFGDITNVFITINNDTNKNARVLLFTKDNMLFYLSRYYLYPKKVIWISEEKDFKK